MASNRLMFLYAIDWLVMILATLISLLVSDVNPDFHTFCVLDLSLSYPNRAPKLSLSLLILLTIIFPVLTIVLLFLLSIFYPRHPRGSLRTSPFLAQKFHSLNRSLLGLGVSLVTSTVIFTGVKNLSGKPRPDFLAICNPDLNAVEQHTVGGVKGEWNSLWVMVDVEICLQEDKRVLRDGFRSFPSGYSTIAFAGLWYLSLLLCHRFGVGLYPTLSSPSAMRPYDLHVDEQGEPLLSEILNSRSQTPAQASEEVATLPVYMLLLPYIPLGLAIFVAGTRYFDFKNHGFDVLVGAAVGSTTAWVGFRSYHPALNIAKNAA